jgi:hypothetical protein
MQQQQSVLEIRDRARLRLKRFGNPFTDDQTVRQQQKTGDSDDRQNEAGFQTIFRIPGMNEAV